MGIVSGAEILWEAERGGYAVGGFDAFDLESARAVVEAAEAERAPVFLQVCVTSMAHIGSEALAGAMLQELAEGSSVPIAIHFDHGPDPSDYDQLVRCVEAGFNSIMADGSKFPLEENIRFTKRFIDFAHPRGVSVEAELGTVSRNLRATSEELTRLMTDPDEAEEFVERTGVDYLAVSIGSVSGFYESPKLNIERLREIKRGVPVPLVLHGGTGVPEGQIGEAMREGVRKINFATGIRRAFLNGFYLYVATHPNEIDPRRALGRAEEAMREEVRKSIRILMGGKYG